MDVVGELNRIISTAQTEANAALEGDDYAEAKRVLAGAVRDLRDLKRQITDNERSVRDSYQDARLKTRQTGQTVGLFVGSKTRGAMARGRAMEGRRLAGAQADALRPFANAKAQVDKAIAAMDRAKADVTNQAAEAKESGAVVSKPTSKASPPPPPPPSDGPSVPPPPPAWKSDPTGRHEHRYWDGSQWTEHVSDAGVAGVGPA